MKKYISALCLMLALGVLLIFASPGYCYREKPEEVIESSCTHGVKKILVTYDTEHGATAIVAKKIADTLCAEDFSVELVFVENLDPAEILNYDAIVIGSPIYIGKWLPGIKKLLKRNHATIAQIPSAFFITCTYIKGEEDTPERYAHAIELYMDPVLSKYPDIMPIDKGVLAGEFQYAELYPLQFFLMKLAKFEEGNFIDNAKIEAWAKGFGEKL